MCVKFIVNVSAGGDNFFELQARMKSVLFFIYCYSN